MRGRETETERKGTIAIEIRIAIKQELEIEIKTAMWCELVPTVTNREERTIHVLNGNGERAGETVEERRRESERSEGVNDD